jgi:hypothetical protein
MPIVKLAALAVIVGMTALPFVSCGPVNIAGHEILRNVPPDTGTEKSPEGAGPFEVKRNADRLFDEKHAWLHWLYIGVLVVGALGLLVPAASRTPALLGAAGIAGTFLFLDRFTAMAEEGTALIRWEIGAYLAIAGFGAMLLVGLGVGRAGGGRKPARPRDTPP